MLKRFVVEAIIHYEAYGGIEDLKAAFHTCDEAQKWIDEQIQEGNWAWDRYRIVDLHDTILFDKGVAL